MVSSEAQYDDIKRVMSSAIGAFTATTIVHGFDVIRISQHTNIIPQYTFKYLYRGYIPGLIRQLTYSVPNMVLFSEMITRYKYEHGTEPPLLYKTVFGAISGAVGGFAGTPSEVLLIRAINPTIPAMKTAAHIRTVYNSNGISGFFRGAYASTSRSALFNSIRLSTYSESKLRIQQTYPSLEGTSQLHFISAFFGTSLGIFVSNPVDYVKSRLQNTNNQKKVAEIVQETYHMNGIKGFYKGMVASLCKSIPHSVISFIVLERLTRIFTGKDAI